MNPWSTVVVHSAAARAILGEQWDKYFSELPVAYFNEFEVLEPSVRKSLLPSKEVVAGRDVVVFRVLMTGASMRHYLPDFADLLKEEGITKNVEGYFISSSEISADEPFFSDWAESRTGELPKVTLVQDNDFASWLNSRDLNDTSKTIHGQTYFQQVGLDMLEEPVKFERNPASELIDRKVQLMTKQPTKSEACGYFRNLSDAERKTDSTRYHLSM